MLKSFIKGLIALCFLWVVYGFTIPDYQWYITDTVWIFSAAEKTDLTAKITEIEKATGIEIAILAVPTVDDDINLAAVDVGDKRWVGKKGQNNWLIVLLAIDDRKWSIQVGYGLEWILPDLVTKQIGEARFPPNFKAGNYYQWISEMLDDVLWYIKQDPAIMATYDANITQTTSTSSGRNENTILFMFIAFVSIIWWFSRWVTVPSTGKKRKMRKYGRRISLWVWLLLSLIVWWIVASFVFAFITSYMFLLFSILAALKGATRWPGGIFFWGGWWSSGWWSWGSSFGGFGWWSFGWGGSSGSR